MDLESRAKQPRRRRGAVKLSNRIWKGEREGGREGGGQGGREGGREGGGKEGEREVRREQGGRKKGWWSSIWHWRCILFP